MSENTNSMSLGDILDECLEVETKQCVNLIYKWRRSTSNIKYDNNQSSIDIKKMLAFLDEYYSKK